MENARSFMLLAAAFSLFIGACTYAAQTVQAMDHATWLVYNLNVNSSGKVHTTQGDTVQPVYSGAQILFMIRNAESGEANIEVNGTLYVSGNDYTELDPTPFLLHEAYQANYLRDRDGNLTKISFRS
ncbi:hypothetical protein B9G55_04655 [Saccharibacillus sp. O16]|nr:hypothetical protein B9G55_04655 [Saccharibacillus sp. O16]